MQPRAVQGKFSSHLSEQPHEVYILIIKMVGHKGHGHGWVMSTSETDVYNHLAKHRWKAMVWAISALSPANLWRKDVQVLRVPGTTIHTEHFIQKKLKSFTNCIYLVSYILAGGGAIKLSPLKLQQKFNTQHYATV